MTITIPMWAIYILAGVIGLGVLALAVLGVFFIITMWGISGGWR